MIKKIWNKLFGKREMMSFKQSFELTDLPLLTFYQDNNKLNFLLDTGSSSCIIDSNILENIQYEETDEKSSLYGLEGNKQIRSRCIINLKYKDKVYECDCIVNDMGDAFTHFKKECGVTLHGILGSDFFNKYKYVLDFDSLVAYSKEH